MSEDLPPRFFKPSCPSGGNFYACETGTRFVGCCRRQPCDSVGCTAGTLEPASFGGKFHGLFPDQQCSSGLWYTCNGTAPPFMGCCESNPCAKGCPAADLAPGFLDSNPLVAAPFLSTAKASASLKPNSRSISSSASRSSNGAPSSSIGAISSSTGITASPVGASSSSTTAAQPQSTTESASGRISPGAIAGIVVGGIAFIALLILIAIIVYFHRRKTATAAPAEPMRVEKDGEVVQSEQVYHHYTPHEIHEAPGDDGITQDVKDPMNLGNNDQPKSSTDRSCVLNDDAGSAYPSPSPAYSPGQHPSSRSPPGHLPLNELDSPSTPFLRHQDSHQSFELPLSPGRANDVHAPVQSGMPSEGLGINLAARSSRSTIPTSPDRHPSPLATRVGPNVSPQERGSRWNYRD